MADLIVSFSRYSGGAPIAQGSKVRTELIEIGAESEQGALTANKTDRHCHLEAGADCWVAVGADPEAEAPDGPTEGWSAVWPMKSGSQKDLEVEHGEKVAVIQM